MVEREMVDLFGDKIVERVSEAKRKSTQPKSMQRGQAPARPVRRARSARTDARPAARARAYWICRLMEAHWTGGLSTDIRMRSPACQHWEKDAT